MYTDPEPASSDTGGTSSAVLDSSPESVDSSPAISSTDDTGDGAAAGSPGSLKAPVPYDRFEEVNQKYRKLQWAEQYADPENLRQRYELTELIDRDPLQVLRMLYTQAQQRGLIPAQVQPQAPAEASLPQPDIAYRDPQTGQLLKTYSAEQWEKRLQAALQQQEQTLASRLQPVERFIGAQQEQWRAQTDAQRILADAETWDYFSDFKTEIHAAMTADRRLSLEGAYRKVVVPKIRELERQSVLSGLKEKPAANTTSPARSHPGGSEDLTKVPIAKLFQREMRKRGFGT